MQIRTETEESQIAGFYYQAYKQRKIRREEGRMLTDYLDRFTRATTIHRAVRYWYDGFVGFGNARSGNAVVFLIVGREKGEIKPLLQLSVSKRDVHSIYDCLHDFLLGTQKATHN